MARCRRFSEGCATPLGLGLAVLIVAESVNAKNGIGALLSSARQYAQTDVVLLCISLYALLGLLTDMLVRVLELRLLPMAERLCGAMIDTSLT